MKSHAKSATNQATWVGVVRIVLGMLLIWRGLHFIQDASHLQTTIGVGAFSGTTEVIAAIVSIITLIAGIALIMGFFTRVVSVTEIGVMAVALIFFIVNRMERSLLDIVFSVVVLTLLVFYAKNGSGPISVDKPLQGDAKT